jgi:hypothetical protein
LTPSDHPMNLLAEPWRRYRRASRLRRGRKRGSNPNRTRLVPSGHAHFSMSLRPLRTGRAPRRPSVRKVPPLPTPSSISIGDGEQGGRAYRTALSTCPGIRIDHSITQRRGAPMSRYQRRPRRVRCNACCIVGCTTASRFASRRADASDARGPNFGRQRNFRQGRCRGGAMGRRAFRKAAKIASSFWTVSYCSATF